MSYTPTQWVNGSAPAISASNLNKLEAGIQIAQGGHVPFSSFAGSTDDAKLAAAVSYINAQTYKPALVLDEPKLYTFNNQHPTPGDGFHMTGPLGGMNGHPEQSSHNTSFARVKINYTSSTLAWIYVPDERWCLRYSNIDFVGNSNVTWFNAPTNPLWRAQFWNLSFNLFHGVIGRAGQRCVMTACDVFGQWNIANSYNTPIRITGSDNNLFMDGAFIDSGITSGVTDGTPHVWMDYVSKSNIGPVYCTARNNWTGLYVTGSTTYGAGLVQLPGGRWEGKNEAEFCRGSVVRVDGGSLTWYGGAANFGMGATNARGDLGTIHHAGGDLTIGGIAHARADGINQDMPFVYSTGGNLSVQGINISTQGGNTWTDKPVVYVSSGGNLVHADTSVRIDPIKERPARFYSGATAPTNPRKGDMWANSGGTGFQIWSGSAWGTTRVS